MKNSDDIFESLGGSFFRYLIDSTDDKNKSAQVRLMLVAVAILAFVGVEANKVIFRNNFGSKGLSIFRLILVALAFGFIGFATLAAFFVAGNGDKFSEIEPMGSRLSFLATGIFYISLCAYVLAKGIKNKLHPNDKIHPNYRGDSTILAFLMKDGWSQAKVQNLAEPLCALALGVFLTAVNVFWGVPLIVCAISAWLHLLMEAFMGLSQVRDTLAERGYSGRNEQTISEVTH